MADTCQADSCYAVINEELKDNPLVKGTYTYVMFQHKVKSLVYSVWTDNMNVKRLSNYHTPEIMKKGVKRRKRYKDIKTGRMSLEKVQSVIPCLIQNKD